MRRCQALLMVSTLCFVMTGCTSPRADESSEAVGATGENAGRHARTADASATGDNASAETGKPQRSKSAPPVSQRSYQFTLQSLGLIPNSGVQLPVVSPNGRWIAWLDPGDSQPTPESVLTGDQLSRTRLMLAPVSGDGRRTVLTGGACWPRFSPDGQTLLAVRYTERGHARLAVHEIRSGRTKLIGVGLQHIAAPAVSPDGRTLAVAGWQTHPWQARLYLIDLRTQQARPGPEPPTGQYQMAPAWRDEQTLLYIAAGRDGAALKRWRVDAGDTSDAAAPQSRQASTTISPLQAAGLSPRRLVRARAPLPDPLSPDKTRYLYMNARNRGLSVVNLHTGGRTAISRSAIAALWWNRRTLAVADRKRLRLVQPRAQPLPQSLLSGRTLPRRVAPPDLYLLAPGGNRWQFEIIRLRLRQACAAR